MAFDFQSIIRFLEELSYERFDPYGSGEREVSAESRERRRRLRRSRPDWERVTTELGLPYTRSKNPQGLPIIETGGTIAGFGFEVCTDLDTSGARPNEITRFRVHYPSLELGLKLRSSLERGSPTGRLKHRFFTERGSTELVQAYATDERLEALRATLTLRVRELSIGDTHAEYWIDSFRPTAQGLEQEIERLGELAQAINAAPGTFGVDTEPGQNPPPRRQDASRARPQHRRDEFGPDSVPTPATPEVAEPDERDNSAPRADSASAVNEQAAASQPALDFAPLALDLFQDGGMSHEVKARFANEFAGRRVHGTGTLASLREFTSDLQFDGPGILATIDFPELQLGPYAGDVHCLIALAPDVELDALVGQSITFEGQLRACDPFMRKVFVDSAAMRRRYGARTKSATDGDKTLHEQ